MINTKKVEQYQDQIARLFPYKYNRFEETNKIQTPCVTFQVTDDCSLKCTYCYQICKGHHSMQLDVAKRFIDLLLDNDENTQQYLDTRACDAVIIEFIGGEPFMEPVLMDQIVEYFRQQVIIKNHPWQYNWMISISSNGMHHFEPEVQAFIEKYHEHLSLNITIDGNKELHDSCRLTPEGEGSYDKAMAAVIDYTTRYGASMGSKMTIAPENVMYVYDAVKSFIENGYRDINLNCVFEKGWDEGHATTLYYQLKDVADYILDNNLEDEVEISIFSENMFKPKSKDDTQAWCGGNGSMISVDWKGDIYPCIRYMESSLGPGIEPVVVGNVYDGIMTNAKCRNCINCLKAVNRITASNKECLNCPIAEGCAQCLAYDYQDAGGKFNHRATYICIMHKARALANCYYWNMKYWKHGQNQRMKLWLPDNEALKIISQRELDNLKAVQFPIL